VLQAQGIEVGLVAKLAGHKNAVVTLSHYTHAMRGGEESARPSLRRKRAMIDAITAVAAQQPTKATTFSYSMKPLSAAEILGALHGVKNARKIALQGQRNARRARSRKQFNFRTAVAEQLGAEDWRLDAPGQRSRGAARRVCMRGV
jgi:hypothetical protein